MNTAKNDLAGQVREYVTSLRDKQARLKTERQELVDQRENLLSAPINVDDARQFVFDYIDTRAAQYLEAADWHGLFASIAYPKRYVGLDQPHGPLCLRDVDAALYGSESERNAAFTGGLCFFGSHLSVNKHTDLAAYFFFGDIIKSRIDQHFATFFPGYNAADAARVGVPISERREQLAKIAARVSELDDEIRQIDTELNDLHISARERTALPQRPASASGDAERDTEIRCAYNGRNADELASKYRVPVHYVEAVGNRP